jgi:hypothetical protein
MKAWPGREYVWGFEDSSLTAALAEFLSFSDSCVRGNVSWQEDARMRTAPARCTGGQGAHHPLSGATQEQPARTRRTRAHGATASRFNATAAGERNPHLS